MGNKIIIIFLIIMQFSCSDPYKMSVPTDINSLENDGSFKAAVEKLPKDEKELVGAYIVRTGLGKVFGGEGIAPGTTIRKAIDDQRAFMAQKEKEEAAAAALAARVKAETDKKIRNMNEAVTVAVTSFRFNDRDWNRGIATGYFSISVAFENKTNRAIAGAKGKFKINDIFGTQIGAYSLSYDNGIKPRSTAVWKGQSDYNQFMERDRKLATTSFEKLKFEWEPEIYLFEDGEKWSVSEE